MIESIWMQLGPTVNGVAMLITFANVALHIIYAAGVARDVSVLHKRNLMPLFIPGVAWVIATLLGGIFVLVAYWAIHHSSLARG